MGNQRSPNPVSINITNYKSKNDGLGGGIEIATSGSYAIAGQINIKNCIVDSPKGVGVVISNYNADLMPHVTLEDILVINPNSLMSTVSTDIQCRFNVLNLFPTPIINVGNLTFIRCGVKDTRTTKHTLSPFWFNGIATDVRTIKNVKLIDCYTDSSNYTSGNDILRTVSLLKDVNVSFINPPVLLLDAGQSVALDSGHAISVSANAVLTLPKQMIILVWNISLETIVISR
ncbi:hypothetical protein [Clostridium estertheticum]|uniref:hypothetical protein n=1 Tax=Clostridium estertheticum TaxID=238834 RepID=UPI001CF53C34|nr:hypothetical protein [Clostridium estertheticum]MCB2339600.1 hypothetical protein [Clostridium estertheticum]